MAEPGTRARNRAQVEAALLEAGRRQLAEVGAAALSVRAVARDMGMAPSALFRYISGRDDLLTLLIVDAYSDLADHVEAAESAVERADLDGRWQALAHAVRGWARAHPHQWALIYGSPVPSYAAPTETTTPAGTRVTDLLAALGVDAVAAGRVTPALGADGPALAAAATSGLAHLAIPAVPLAHGILAWTTLVGLVSTEVFEQLGTELGDADALFGYGVRAAGRLMLGPPPAHGTRARGIRANARAGQGANAAAQ